MTHDKKPRDAFIRNNESKPCKKIVDFDANALYLWALKQDIHHQEKAKDNFRLVKRDR